MSATGSSHNRLASIAQNRISNWTFPDQTLLQNVYLVKRVLSKLSHFMPSSQRSEGLLQLLSPKA